MATATISSQTKKARGYSLRKGIPASDHDSDSDFGQITSEDELTKGKGKRRTKKKPSEALKGTTSKGVRKRKRIALNLPGVTISGNPLREILGSDLDIWDLDDKKGKVPSEEEESDEDDSDGSQSHHSLGPARYSIPAPRSAPAKGDTPTDSEPEETQQSNAPDNPHHDIDTPTETETETETESESESEAEHSTTSNRKRKAESQIQVRPAKKPKQDNFTTMTQEESLEMDERTSSASDQDLTAKPMFPLDRLPKLPRTGPLVLDSKTGMQVPAPINRWLRDYQEQGVKFFWERWISGRGGILGDDMGLGKTIQVIAFLSCIMSKTGYRGDKKRRYKRVDKLLDSMSKKDLPKADSEWPTCLIVCPTSVIGNWQRELKTWGYFEVGLFLGDREHRDRVLADFVLGRLDIVVMSFNMARRYIDSIDTLPWSCVFVDEAHTLKNRAASITQALNQFLCQIRFGLTGTAIQNSYKEFWPLLDWANPGKVGTAKDWQRFITRPLTVGQSKTATKEQFDRRVKIAERFVQRLLPLFFLRRTKDLIANQMPKKTDHVVFCPLTPEQIRVYKLILATPDAQLIIHSQEICDCGEDEIRGKCCFSTTEDGKKWNENLFKYMSILIKVSNHLYLLYPGSGDSSEQRQRSAEILAIAYPKGPPQSGLAIHDNRMCGKWDVLCQLLKNWQRDPSAHNKVLIFSRSVRLLETIEHNLQVQGYNFEKLDGSVPQADRMAKIDSFNNDPDIFVFLISTLAGGTGLNLTAANKVIIFDPSWNPAHDLQAMDRAYRVGQLRDVHVYRLLGAGSIEELMYARQLYKQQQMRIGYEASVQTRYFGGVQDDPSKRGELFGIENIFRLHEGDLSTKCTIENAHFSETGWTDDNKPEDQGLTDLFFNETTPTDLQTIKKSGVKYMHDNEAVLKAVAQNPQKKPKIAKRKSVGKPKPFVPFLPERK